MKKILISGIEYEVASNWSEVTLGKQIYVVEHNGDYQTETQKKIGILSGYSGIPYPVLKRTTINDLKELFQVMSFINKPLPDVKITSFQFNRDTYYVGQNILEQEFQDYISLQNTYQQYRDNHTLALPFILAVMCKRKMENGLLETIDDYDVEARAKEFYDLPITIANSIALFFSQNINELSHLFQQFSNPKEIVEMKLDEVESTLKKQDGQGLPTRCVNGICRWYLRYIRRGLNKHFTS